MHLSQLFTLALVGFATNVVAAPLVARDPALNAIPTKPSSIYIARREPTPPPAVKRAPALNAGSYKQIINNAAEDIEKRQPALNAVAGYKQIINNAADQVERRQPALNAGYKESVQNAAAEKRALNAFAGYRQTVNNAAADVEKREPALNAGYNQVIKPANRRSAEAEPALNAGYNQIYNNEDLAERSPAPEPALNAGTYKQVVYPGAAPAPASEAEKRDPALNAGSYSQIVKPANKRSADPAPALNAGYNQVVKPANRRSAAPAPALNAGYNQIYKPAEDLAERSAPTTASTGYSQTVCNKRALNACRIANAQPHAARDAEPALNAGYSQIVEPEQR